MTEMRALPGPCAINHVGERGSPAATGALASLAMSRAGRGRTDPCCSFPRADFRGGARKAPPLNRAGIAMR